MAARVHKVRLEFVGGPNDGEVHVVGGRRFVLGPAEDSDVRYEAERCLQGKSRVVFEFDKQGRLFWGGVLDTPDGEEPTEKVLVAEGQVLGFGATEILVAEIAFEGGDRTGGRAQVRLGEDGAGDPQVECANPKCGAPNPAERMWCHKCGRDL